MSRRAIETLAERWKDDPSFREELRHDLEGAVARAGLQLNEDEWAVLRDTDWSLSDEELQTRMASVIG